MSRLRQSQPAPRKTARFRAQTAGVVVVLMLLLVACADGGASTSETGNASEDPAVTDPADVTVADDGAREGDTIQVVVTTSILGDVVETLVQDDGEVTVMIPPGVDPHAYEPSAQTVAALRGADLVVANGLWLEASLVGPLDAAAQDGGNVFEVAQHLNPLPFGAHDDDVHDDDVHDDDDHDDDVHDGHDGHAHGSLDPHFWFDPLRMARAVELIADELAALDSGVGADQWQQRAQDYRAELRDLDAEIAREFMRIPDERRLLVTNHDALGYLADRYDFEVLGTVIPGVSTHAAADPAAFAALIETVEDAQVPAIFAENTTSSVLAEQLASEVVDRTDLEVVVVQLTTDALGAPGSGAETYIDLLRTNARLIADALS